MKSKARAPNIFVPAVSNTQVSRLTYVPSSNDTIFCSLRGNTLLILEIPRKTILFNNESWKSFKI